MELNPELERMIQEQLASGQFNSIDEVLTMALSRLPHKRCSDRTAVERMIQFSRTHSVRLPPGEKVKDFIHESHRY